MTDEQLLTAVKAGLSMQDDDTFHDVNLTQKILGVKQYMKDAGVKDDVFNDNSLAINAIVLGVNDMWNLSNGVSKFSSMFNMMVTQLTASGDDDV